MPEMSQSDFLDFYFFICLAYLSSVTEKVVDVMTKHLKLIAY